MSALLDEILTENEIKAGLPFLMFHRFLVITISSRPDSEGKFRMRYWLDVDLIGDLNLFRTENRFVFGGEIVIGAVLILEVFSKNRERLVRLATRAGYRRRELDHTRFTFSKRR